MFTRSIRKFSQAVNAQKDFCFSSSHSHHPKQPVYAPKVSEKLIWINIYNRGTFERIPAYPGETMLKALERFKMGNVNGECGGGEELFAMTEKVIDKNTQGPFCNGCMVDIHEPWFSKMTEMHFLEERQIDSSFYPSTDHTRLACCLVLEPWMDDITISTLLNEVTPE